ncbi:MAG: ferredoxin [Pseudomonadota bacterium]
MVGLADIEAVVAGDGLAVTGAFHPEPGEAPEGVRTLCMLGADGPAMWAVFSAGPEAKDGGRDPLDRWSARVIGRAAEELGGHAFFPFGGPPWQPFMAWAKRAEGAASSPLGMVVTASRGLMASWRGALGFAERVDLSALEPPAPPLEQPPCAACAAPCETSCPVGAFGADGYAADSCAAYVASAEGLACRTGGCLARRACPQNIVLPEAQSAFHLAAFVAGRTGR